MTSTEFTAGIAEGCRISSKVLKPPGGGSSDIFGLGNSHYAQSRSASLCETVNSSTHSRLFGHSENLKTSGHQSNENLPTETKNVSVQQSTITGGKMEISLGSENKVINDNKEVIVKYNPITGEEICYDFEKKITTKSDNTDLKEKKPENMPTNSIQTSTRIRHPPGGKSSGIF